MAVDAQQTQHGEIGARAVLDIEGMTCASCVATITEGLAELPGIVDVNVNLATNVAIVEYSASSLTPQEMARAITDVGYGAHIVTAGDAPKEDVATLSGACPGAGGRTGSALTGCAARSSAIRGIWRSTMASLSSSGTLPGPVKSARRVTVWPRDSRQAGLAIRAGCAVGAVAGRAMPTWPPP